MTDFNVNNQMQEEQYCTVMSMPVKCAANATLITKQFYGKMNKAAKKYVDEVTKIYFGDDTPIDAIKNSWDLWTADVNTVVEGAVDYLDENGQDKFWELDKDGCDVSDIMLEIVKSQVEKMIENLGSGCNISDEFKEKMDEAVIEYICAKTGELCANGWPKSAIATYWYQDGWKHAECAMDYLEDGYKEKFNKYKAYNDFGLMETAYDIMSTQIEELIQGHIAA